MVAQILRVLRGFRVVFNEPSLQGQIFIELCRNLNFDAIFRVQDDVFRVSGCFGAAHLRFKRVVPRGPWVAFRGAVYGPGFRSLFLASR